MWIANKSQKREIVESFIYANDMTTIMDGPYKGPSQLTTQLLHCFFFTILYFVLPMRRPHIGNYKICQTSFFDSPFAWLYRHVLFHGVKYCEFIIYFSKVLGNGCISEMCYKMSDNLHKKNHNTNQIFKY